MVVTRRMASAKSASGDINRPSISTLKKVAANGTETKTNATGWSIYKEKVKCSVKENWLNLTEPERCSWWPFPTFLLLIEVIINILIIEKVNYTEIDWKAYMQVNRF